MKTRFDDIRDEEIEKSISDFGMTGEENEFFYYSTKIHVNMIAILAAVMNRYKCWVGKSVTIFGPDCNFDGNHRVRACKFLANRYDLQIQIPVRFAPQAGSVVDDKREKENEEKDDLCRFGTDYFPYNSVGGSLCL